MKTTEWTWMQLNLHDEPIALTVDIVAANDTAPQRVIYMLPGGAMNFAASFLTPARNNLVRFFVERGYLVVGVSPREDNVPPDTEDLSFMAQWGMLKHRQDIRLVVSRLQPIAGVAYEVLGHSYGAASALDYAAEYADELKRVIALDIYSIDPKTRTWEIDQAARTYDAYVRLLERGVYADTSYVGFKSLARAARVEATNPISPTWDDLRAVSRLAARGVLFLSLIDAAPYAARSPLTGLPSDWPLASSVVASAGDLTSYAHTDFKTIAQATTHLGSELISLAFARDYWSVVAANGVQRLNWAGIQEPVIWMNTELGYNDQTFGAKLIEASGNRDVKVSVIAGYGHADILWSKTAEQDAWSQLVP